MATKMEKILFMLRKLKRDLSRGDLVYPLAEEVHSKELREYYFIMEEQALRAGISQNFHFDDEGIPIIPSYIDVEERRMVYYPISIGQFGLSIFHTYLNTGCAKDRERFLNIVDWFYRNARSDNRLGNYWLTDVPKPEFKLFDPWPSAFAQSRGISILLRGYQLTGEEKYLFMATEALKIFRVPAAEGGVTSFTEYGPIYEEYPAPFLTAVLDGSIFSLFGLYDYVRAVGDSSPAKPLFDEGIAALRAILPRYDLGYWIRYNLCDQPFYPTLDPASITYFRLVNSQLRLLYRITGDSSFLEIAERWKSYDRFINIARMYWFKYRALRKLNRI